jgi:hypothetical protein
MDNFDFNSPSVNETQAETRDTKTNDLYKYKKIGAIIPKLIDRIEHLSTLDANFETNLDLIKSKKRLNSIDINAQAPSEEEIIDFADSLAKALYSLTDGIQSINMNKVAKEKQGGLVDILADISLIQEDIIKFAS